MTSCANAPALTRPYEAGGWRATGEVGGSGATTERRAEEVADFEAGDSREWRGHDVVDADEHKTGKLESVYVGIATVQPAEHRAGSGPDRE